MQIDVGDVGSVCDSGRSPGGEGCHFLPQWIFPIQGLKLCLLCLLHWQADSLPLCHMGNPIQNKKFLENTKKVKIKLSNQSN